MWQLKPLGSNGSTVDGLRIKWKNNTNGKCLLSHLTLQVLSEAHVICDEELLLGQTPQDRSDLVARVFRAKLEDLKDQLLNKHILGKVGEYVYVIEFQKRGLPHAHFLMIMKPEYKITNADHYDKFVSVEIPDPTKYPELYQLVIKHMMHGPCGHLRPSSPCMEGEPRKCRFRYPQQFNDKTTQTDNSYPFIISVKYLFKYVIHVDPDREDVVINEIKRFQDARYVSPPEAIWRIFSFTLSQIHPCVMALQVHLPNKQLVRFRENDILTDIEQNRLEGEAVFIQRLPESLTWNASSRIWNPRRHGSIRGRLVSANPAGGERYYLRLLLSHISGPTCFEDLYTVNGVFHPTFRKAALERGLIETDDNLSHCLAEASPGDVRKLWDEHYDSLSEDHTRHHGNVEVARYMVLKDIALFLQSMEPQRFDLPSLNAATTLESRGFREVQEEHSIIVEDEHLRARNSLNADQMHAFDEIMRHVDNDWPGVFFVDGPGGTGKTFCTKLCLLTFVLVDLLHSRLLHQVLPPITC
ncbi:LOW QUALITY PROTEIN: hypothetical protein OSB04_020603 [Centaurea solstitialis]|uniref:ATP-dependent DNA helicase n=1 Tax=Centaurea solstitialis TaxID=347529 RepID=A0AA38WDF3_9ASTR|nr:LOW QUALITY PROTEIN: hypothetical protein OSB04_020603 [Centaurea solstitialis]